MKNSIHLGFNYTGSFSTLTSALNNKMKIETVFIELCLVAGKEKANVLYEEIKIKSKSQIKPNHIYIIEELSKAIEKSINK